MVDIIIPIYNAYDDLVKCINSVKMNTDLVANRLVLINDCSPDERIAKYINSLATENIIVIHNETNKGFSANVNKGFSCSDKNDVILLNSDTVVTKGWVEKLNACAHRDEMIATVTPLSNSADICSVPVFAKKNEIPKNYTIDEMAELVEKHSLKRYPRIPVAIGYCMYIKRGAIDVVGKFDADTFQRGYGEENDFCFRAVLNGYYHVLCDDTYIYHSGSVSFTLLGKDVASKMAKQHSLILKNRYPKQVRECAEFVEENPICEIQNNVKFWIGMDKIIDAYDVKKSTILFMSHRDFDADAHDNIGGVQLHVKDLVNELKANYNVVVLARDCDKLAISVYSGEKSGRFMMSFESVNGFSTRYSYELRQLYKVILKAFNVSQVHIHHIEGMSVEMFNAAKELEIRLICSLHDHYFICPNVTLLTSDKTFCDGETDCNICKECLSNTSRIGSICKSVDFQVSYRKQNNQILNLCSQIIAPSEDLKRRYVKVYPNLADKIIVIPHGIKLPDIEVNAKIRNPKEALRVAFLGGISEIKGSKLAYQMIKNGRDIEWFIIGEIGDGALNSLNQKNLHKLGAYKRDEIFSLLCDNKIDIVCISTILAETFCYTLSEAVGCRIPVVCFDIGAQGERVKSLKCGSVVPFNMDYTILLNEIRKIANTPEYYKELRDNCNNVQISSIEDMMIMYEEIYSLDAGSNRTIDVGALQEKYLEYSRDDNKEIMRKAYRSIECSNAYKLGRRFIDIIPNRDAIKKGLKKLHGK